MAYRDPTTTASRSRSFEGCATCRSRHTKCDEAKPACSTCTQLGLSCGGYEKNIFFSCQDPNTGAVRFRRPLFTEKERESMSKWLTSNAPPKSVLRYIFQVEELGESASLNEDLQVSCGPFGVFRSNEYLTKIPVTLNSDSPKSRSLYEDHSDGTNDFLFSSDALTSSWADDFTQIDKEPSIQAPNSPLSSFWNVIMDKAAVDCAIDASLLPNRQISQPSQPEEHSFESPQLISCNNHDSSVFSSLTTMTPAVGNAAPRDAVLLLKHYTTTIITSLTPFNHAKSPWHILFVPQAKSCLAAFALEECINHANLSLFYGTLAISAYSLGSVSQSSVWTEKAKWYKRAANYYVKMMLKSAYSPAKQFKYKSILMALIVMTQLALFSGNHRQTEEFHLETEKFIRVRGLNKKKSRKVRLLHHCYAFERVLYESTCSVDEHSSHRHQVRKAIESSGMIIYSQDSLSFRLPSWNNLDQAMLEVKGQAEGENDLHLERPGIWAATLYPEIFGVPEEYLILLSLVIRLGREKDTSGQRNGTEYIGVKEFFSQAKAIEKCIKQLQLPMWPLPNLSENITQAIPVILNNMLEAMREALFIYFYRRIYDIDSTLLQPKVERVCSCLPVFMADESGIVSGTTRFIWPALIAACEAGDPELQARFSKWFRDSACRTGLQIFNDTAEKIEHVWEEKDRRRGTNLTWAELMGRDGSVEYLL